jgi:hypothetical protein
MFPAAVCLVVIATYESARSLSMCGISGEVSVTNQRDERELLAAKQQVICGIRLDGFFPEVVSGFLQGRKNQRKLGAFPAAGRSSVSRT